MTNHKKTNNQPANNRPANGRPADTRPANNRPIGAVMVVGGGIGGIQASLDLADSGYKVYLVESKPSIGGVMPQLDKTFPTNDCSMCILSPKLMDCGRHPNIEILTQSDIEKISGEAGDFTVSVIKRPRYIDEAKCSGCGLCTEKCPTSVPSEFDRGLKPRKAIYMPFPQAVPNKPTIDPEHCLYFTKGKCQLCKKTCQADAINYEQKTEHLTIQVGAVILACGYELFDAHVKPGYGYGQFENVITSIEFERILSASGPFEGHLERLSDHREPRKIAFIQCVGSRDTSCRIEYCSSVCCTYAIKEAVIAQEHAKDGLETAIFYMDMRTFGKGFDPYYERAKEEYGVRFIRSRVSEIYEVPETKNLQIRYIEDGALQREEFDLVVLSVGFLPQENAKKMAEIFGISLNEHGFCRTSEFSPVETIREGIYVCGAFAGPKDIPETVMQASGAAGKASALLSKARGRLIKQKVYPAEMSLNGQPPRIGAIICHCGINIGGYLDVPAVVEYARTLPNVVYAEDSLYACSPDMQRRIVEIIKTHQLDRLIVASCTPRTHEPLFRETLKEAGLNPHLFEMANIRDQCSWIHMNDPKEATLKAKDLVRIAVRKVGMLEPLPVVSIGVLQKGLVIGGGLAGMTAALEMASQGFEVHLIEKEAELGGNLRNLHRTIEGNDVRDYLGSLITQVENNPLIHVHTNARIEDIEGYVGNYTTRFKTAPRALSSVKADKKQDHNGRNGKGPQPELKNGEGKGIEKHESDMRDHVSNMRAHVSHSKSRESGGMYNKPEMQEIEHGVIIVATGAQESLPKEYAYGEDKRVMTLLEFEKWLYSEESEIKQQNPKSVVMIQCVGSREADHPYCSRVCCTGAIKNVLRLKEKHPDADVYILYRDVRTYGTKEKYYREARDKGVIFVRYDEDQKPDVRSDKNGLIVKVKDPILDRDLELETGLLVLSSCIIPTQGTEELASMLKVPLNTDGFFLEAHMKLRPVDFATEGVFMAGTCHAPKFIDETISQASAAVSRACTILSKNTYQAEAAIACVNEDICSGCGICKTVCSYNAIEIVAEGEKSKAQVTDALCKGCGACAAACPSGAMEQKGFKSTQLLAMVDAALE
ncbi:MAG: FAD-dependent oxidoreductase [bacterium]